MGVGEGGEGRGRWVGGGGWGGGEKCGRDMGRGWGVGEVGRGGGEDGVGGVPSSPHTLRGERTSCRGDASCQADIRLEGKKTGRGKKRESSWKRELVNTKPVGSSQEKQGQRCLQEQLFVVTGRGDGTTQKRADVQEFAGKKTPVSPSAGGQEWFWVQ